MEVVVAVVMGLMIWTLTLEGLVVAGRLEMAVRYQMRS